MPTGAQFYYSNLFFLIDVGNLSFEYTGYVIKVITPPRDTGAINRGLSTVTQTFYQAFVGILPLSIFVRLPFVCKTSSFTPSQN